jgi:hypothetical protein
MTGRRTGVGTLRRMRAPQRVSFRHCTVALGLALGACTPPPAAWPVAGAHPLPRGATAIDLYAAGSVDESGGSFPADGGAGVHARAGERLTLGGSAGVFRADGAIGHVRAYGKLHVAGGQLAPIIGIGAGSDLDEITYGTADVALAAAVPLGAWELYAAPGLGIAVPLDAEYSETTLFPGLGIGVQAQVTPQLTCGVEALLAAVVPLESELDATWSSGLGLFVRYAFGLPAERPAL